MIHLTRKIGPLYRLALHSSLWETMDKKIMIHSMHKRANTPTPRLELPAELAELPVSCVSS